MRHDIIAKLSTDASGLETSSVDPAMLTLWVVALLAVLGAAAVVAVVARRFRG